MLVKITTTEIDINNELKSLQGNLNIGGIASFIGTVRGDNSLHSLTLEHYPNMTEKKLTKIAQIAKQKFSVNDIIIIHRVGEILIGDAIVFVGSNSPHRDDCQNAVAFIMDYLKTDAPFWKMEKYNNGETKWIEQKQIDIDKKNYWG